MIEATFMSGLFAITGIGALLLLFMFKDKIHFNIFNKVKILFYIAGIIFILFGVMNYFTHIGLIVKMIEATFMSGLFAITGIGALLLPFMFKDKIHFNIFNKVKILFYIAGIIFILFGVMNYFTHIGLIVKMIEATFMSGLFAITGIDALLLSFIFNDIIHFNIFIIVKILFYIAVIIFILFGVMNYFTHIGLIVNTME